MFERAFLSGVLFCFGVFCCVNVCVAATARDNDRVERVYRRVPPVRTLRGHQVSRVKGRAADFRTLLESCREAAAWFRALNQEHPLFISRVKGRSADFAAAMRIMFQIVLSEVSIADATTGAQDYIAQCDVMERVLTNELSNVNEAEMESLHLLD